MPEKASDGTTLTGALTVVAQQSNVVSNALPNPTFELSRHEIFTAL